MNELVSIIILTASISLVLNLLFKRINVHTIIGYIIAGAIITNAFDFLSTKSEMLNIIAEFGIAFLMFSIGLEFSISKLKTIKKEVFVYGGLQVLLTSSFFYLVSRFMFGLGDQISIIISLGLALSSTAIVLKLLNDSRLIYKTYGKNAVGVLLFQDMAVIPIMLMISIFANTQNNVNELLLGTSINALIVLGVFFVLGNYILPKFFDIVTSSKSDELFITSILLLVIGSAQFAHIFGFSYSLGTFIAGMIIAKTNYKYQIEADLIPFRDLLLGIFFISVGMQLNFAIIPPNIVLILLLLVGIILSKALIVFAITRFFYRSQTSFKTAILLAQAGEFSFVIFEIAKLNGIALEQEMSQIMLVVIIFSMVLTPFIFNNLNNISKLFLRNADEEDEIPEKNTITDHIIIFGYGGLGQKLVNKIKELNVPYLAVERDRKQIKKGLERGDFVMYGNASKKSILEKANISQAKAAIIAMSNDKNIYLVSKAIEDVSPETIVIARAANLYHKAELENSHVDFIVDNMEITSDAFLNYIANEVN